MDLSSSILFVSTTPFMLALCGFINGWLSREGRRELFRDREAPTIARRFQPFAAEFQLCNNAFLFDQRQVSRHRI